MGKIKKKSSKDFQNFKCKNSLLRCSKYEIQFLVDASASISVLYTLYIWNFMFAVKKYLVFF